MTRILLIDGNSIGMAAQNTNKLTNGDIETQAVFGSLRTVHSLLKTRDTLAAKPIVFWDGASWRGEVFSDYKGQRDDNPDAVKEKEAFHAQRPWLGKFYNALGVDQVRAGNLEADDLIAMMVRSNAGKRPMTIISGDKDLWQLVGPNVSWHNPINYKHGKPAVRTLTEEDFADSTQYATPRRFVEGKALRGDASDNIPGVGGIGEKGAMLVLDHWGSVIKCIKDIRENGIEAVPDHMKYHRKKLVAFANDKTAITRFRDNMRLMSLIDDHIPPAENRKIIKGQADRDKLTKLCEELGFVSILRDIDQWLENFGATAPAH